MVEKVQIQPRRPVYPTPVGLITSVDATGRPNIIALGEVFNLSIVQPVWVGISVREATYSHGLIKEQEEFVVNLPTADLLDAVLGCGSCSGRDGVDKFQRFPIARDKSVKTSVPILQDAYAAYECQLIDDRNFGDHRFLVGKIVVVHWQEEVFTSGELIDMSRVNPTLYMGRDTYLTIAADTVGVLDRELYSKGI